MKVTIEFNKETLKWDVMFRGQQIGEFDTPEEAAHEYEFAEIVFPSPKEIMAIS